MRFNRSDVVFGGAFAGVGLAIGLVVALAINYLLWAYLNLGLEGALGEYTAATLLAVLVAAVIPFLPISSNIRRTLLILWGLRCVVTLVVMVAYEQHYLVLDAFTYYRTASSGHMLRGLSWMRGTENLIVVISTLIDWIPLLKSYPALKVLFSLLGLIGSYLFWLSYVAITKDEDSRLLLLLGAYPSLIFWSSILGKDPIVFLGLGMYCYAAVRLLQKPTLPMMLLFAAGVSIVSTIRMWMSVVILISFSLTYLFNANRFVRKSIVSKILILAAVTFLAGTLIEKLSINSKDDVFDRINTVSRGWSIGGSQQEVPQLKSFREIVTFLPLGMFTSLFRPLPGEVGNAFGLIAGFENVILLMIAFQIFRNSSTSLMRERYYRFFAATIILWSMLYAMISYQNLGTASRFKIQALPFLLILFYYLKFRTSRGEDAKRIISSPWARGT